MLALLHLLTTGMAGILLVSNKARVGPRRVVLESEAHWQACWRGAGVVPRHGWAAACNSMSGSHRSCLQTCRREGSPESIGIRSERTLRLRKSCAVYNRLNNECLQFQACPAAVITINGTFTVVVYGTHLSASFCPNWSAFNWTL